MHSVSSEDNCTDSLSPAAAKEPQTGAGTFELLLELPLGVFLALADLVSTACFALVELEELVELDYWTSPIGFGERWQRSVSPATTGASRSHSRDRTSGRLHPYEPCCHCASPGKASSVVPCTSASRVFCSKCVLKSNYSEINNFAYYQGVNISQLTAFYDILLWCRLQWHDWWYLWALKHVLGIGKLAVYGFSQKTKTKKTKRQSGSNIFVTYVRGRLILPHFGRRSALKNWCNYRPCRRSNAGGRRPRGRRPREPKRMFPTRNSCLFCNFLQPM